MIWQTKKLGEICEIIIGRTPSRDKKDYWGNGFDWASISDMNDVYISSTKEQITGIAVKECRCKLIPTGTLLMSFKLSIGKLTFNTKPIYTNEAIVALPIIKDNLIDKTFLYYALKVANLLKNVDRAAKGVTLNKKKLELIEVPLPPLEIQKRIASILNKADRLRQLRKAAIEKLGQLTQSVFLDMFGDPAFNPKDFDIVPLRDMYSKKKSGVKCGPFGSALKKDEYKMEGVPVWTMDNIMENQFSEEGCLFINHEKYNELKPYVVENGDILISRAGTVGKMCVVQTSKQPSIISTNLIRVSLDSTIIEPYYFTSLITFFKGRVGRLKTGNDGAYTFMNTGVLDRLEVPLPPFSLQNRYIRTLNNIQLIKSNMLKGLEMLNTLFNSIIQRAFKGELRFNDELLASMIQAKEDILLMNDALPGKSQK